MARRMLSVPPEVTVPTTSAAPPAPPVAAAAPAARPPSIAAVIDTISASYFTPLGHRSAWSGLVCEVRA